MPSRNVFVPLNPTKSPSAEDVNVIYNLLNGYYDSKKGHGMSVQLTAYDGRLSNGAVNATNYALEVRNRESTGRRVAAFRDNNTSVDIKGNIIAEIRAGLLRAVDPDSATPTTTAQVIVHGTPAGGILTGTYPNPTASSAITFYPTMLVAWYGSASTASVGGQLEVAGAPGWVFCNGNTYNLYAGGTITTPNMADRLPIGVGTISYKGTGGNSWATAAAVSTAHTHTMAHEHTYGHTHKYTHTHSLTHEHTIGVHKHGFDHTHTTPNHFHTLSNHNHTGNTLSWPHEHSHKHSISDHSHGMDDHDHDSGNSSTGLHVRSTDRTSDVFESGSGGGTDLDTTVNLNHGGTNQVAMEGHTHEGNNMEVDGKTTPPHYTSSGADWNVTKDKTSMETQLASTAVSSTGAWTGTTSAPSSDFTDTSGGAAATGGVVAPATTDNQTSYSTTLQSANTTGGQNTDVTTAQTTTAGLTTNITIGQTVNITAGQSVSSINTQPPVLAWYWIMKL